MQKKYKEKIKLVINTISDKENPTSDDRERILIDKRPLRKNGIDDKEIDNILNFLADRGCLNIFSWITYFSEVDLLDNDEIDKNGKKNFSLPYEDRYDFLKENFVVLIPNFDKLNEYKNQLSELSRCLLYKDEDDYFYYNNQLIEMDKQNLYYKILYILYTFSDETGFMPYEQIDWELIKMGEEKNNQGDYKRIKNAISETQGLFRYAKINGKPLENKSVAGKKLIEIIKGRGIKLNNPKI